MHVLGRLNRWLARLLLRGSVLEWWLRRKMRNLEEQYSRTLVEASRGQPAPEAPVSCKRGGALRRMLFISDIMWESKELVPELEKLCSLTILDLSSLLQPLREAELKRKAVVSALRNFIDECGSFEPDLILFYARPALLSEEAFDLLRKKWSCPLFGMNLDEKIEFLPYGIFSAGNDNYQRWAKQFDLNLTNVRAVMDWYADRGLPAYYMPEGFHPKFTSPPSCDGRGYKYELSFVGSKRSEREQLIRRLRSLGIPVEPLGFGWPDSSGSGNPEAVYRASMINLGIGFASPSLTLTTLKTRDFECPGAGACYLTTWNWELALHYDIGREILCYRSEEEVAELFSYYRRRPQECGRIAQAAWRRCVAEHTWERRFRALFQQVGLIS